VKKLGITYNDASIFYEVNQKLTEYNENIANRKQLDEQIKLLENEISVMEERVSSSSKEIDELFDYVDADDEEEYYYNARRHAEYQNNLKQIKKLNDKMN